MPPTSEEQQQRLLTPSDVATFVGVPEPTLAQWRYLKTGPAFIKVGKHVRYRVADVEAWLANHTVRTT